MFPDLPAAASVRPSGAEGQAAQLVVLAVQRCQRVVAGQVPPLDDAVLLCPGEGPDVGGEGHARDLGVPAARSTAASPSSVNHSRTAQSLPTEASVRPSGLKATWRIVSEWPFNVPSRRREATSQRRMVRSEPAEASRRPSGLKATVRTLSVWPSSVASRLPVSASQRRRFFSGRRPAEARTLPPVWNDQRAVVASWAFQPRIEPACCRIPELDRLRIVGVVAPGGEEPAIARKRHGPGLVRVTAGWLGSGGDR